MNRISKVFRPFNLPAKHGKIVKNLVEGKEPPSKGYKLFKSYGIIDHCSPGMYHVLPMGQRVIDKIRRLLEREMRTIGAEKMTLPLLTKQQLWDESDTYLTSKEELYHLDDRNETSYLLSPTHEQAFSNLLSNQLMSYKEFPKLLYQIGSKFRDEHRPKLGLLRSKEFIMKDLYSFDIDEESANQTYEKVTKTYQRFFEHLGLPVFRVNSVSNKATNKSHEFHYLHNVGDDKLYQCPACGTTFSTSEIENKTSCPACSLYIKEEGFCRGIEIAHTFSFNTYYSTRLQSCYVNKDCKRTPLHMSSYGIGITRLMSAVSELLSTDDNELRWPLPIAPYLVCIIPPKAGSRESIEVELQLPELYQLLEFIPTLKNDIIVDDRAEYTIGKRMLEANLFGFPFIIVAGKDATQRTPLFEIHDLEKKTQYLMPKSSLLQYLINRTEYLIETKKKLGYLAGD